MIFDKLKNALAGKVDASEKPKSKRIVVVPDDKGDDDYMKSATQKLTQTDQSGPDIEGVRAMPADKQPAATNLMLRSKKRRMRGM